MKRLICLLSIFLAGCQNSKVISYPIEGELCPQVQILRDEAYLTQYVGYKETFQISISGHQGYCYYDNDVERYRAVIRPIFTIKRLTPSKESDVRFSYYTETVKGPPQYLGKKTYHLMVHIPPQKQEITYMAPETKVFIPQKMIKDYDVNLGLWISPNEAAYNKKTFDINYHYVDE